MPRTSNRSNTSRARDASIRRFDQAGRAPRFTADEEVLGDGHPGKERELLEHRSNGRAPTASEAPEKATSCPSYADRSAIGF